MNELTNSSEGQDFLPTYCLNIFQKSIAQKDIDRIIDLLFANKMISETNNTIPYAF
jgi:hypothetical protein